MKSKQKKVKIITPKRKTTSLKQQMYSMHNSFHPSMCKMEFIQDFHKSAHKICNQINSILMQIEFS